MLVVDHIQRSFGSLAAVSDVSFTCGRGDVFGLLGPNGAGKTTTMRMILGIYEPDAGSITWDGRPIGLKIRRTFGYLPEERGLYGKMKVGEQIAYFGRLHGLRDDVARRRTVEWLKRLEIEHLAGRACSELSKGNQQKVQLAGALLHEPPLLVLDEPFSGLDPVNAEMTLECIRMLAARGTAFVLSSHQMWQIEHACREFCIIDCGRVRARGSLAELRRALPTRTVRVSPDSSPVRAVFTAHGATGPTVDAEGELAYELPAGTDFGVLLREVVAAGPVDAFERQEPSLSDIYVHALGNGVARGVRL
jgi:ABC-2 type transport system ATP-binding protein